MMRLIFAFWLLCLAVWLVPAHAQYPAPIPGCPSPGPQCVTIQNFNPSGSASLTATTVSSSVAFTSTGSNLYALVTNNGPAMAWAVTGNSSVVATPAGTPLFPGVPVAIPQGYATNLAAITLSGTAALTITTGSGVPTIVYAITAPSGGAPAPGQAFSIATGGTAIQVFNPLPPGGALVVNPLAATESLFCDPINAPGTTAPGPGGTTTELPAGGRFIVPPGLVGGPLRCNGATTGHTFTAIGY